MKKKFLSVAISLTFFGLFCSALVSAANYTYTNSADFLSVLDNYVTDDYSNAAYFVGDLFDGWSFDQFTDAGMSAVFGETEYTYTGPNKWWPGNQNFHAIEHHSISGDHYYTNGSFELLFTNTTVGTSNGVYGVGFEIEYETGEPQNYFAYISYANGTAVNVHLLEGYWGFTSDHLITSLHVGMVNGDAGALGSIWLDDLTIGSPIPEPATMLLLGSGLIGLAGFRRKSKE